MSIRESYNEITWKVYRMIHKRAFGIVSVLLIVAVCAVVALVIKADDIAYSRMMKAPNIEKCVKYLDRYPKSEHSMDVESLLVKLKIEKEKKDYDSVCRNTTIESCRYFLSEYPNSNNYTEIEEKLIELEYNNAIQSNDVATLRTFIEEYPQSFHVQSINEKIKSLEDAFYKANINIPIAKIDRSKVNEYLNTFPDGRYVSKARAKLHALDDEDAYLQASSTNTKSAWQYYLSIYPKGLHARQARSRIQEFEEIEHYQNYSLPNDSQPYAKYYGRNYSHSYSRAQVQVRASAYSDVVVIVRYNDKNGKVAGHSYIQKGCSSTIYLPPEHYYQVFFYFGRGWYPKKSMSNGVKGGFLNSEQFSKDGSSMYLGYGEGVSYTLTQQVNGNFSTSGSSENEMF